MKSIDKLQGKVGGLSYTVCPAQREGSKVTCNDCGLCDATKRAVDVIVFIEHGMGKNNIPRMEED